MNFKKIKAVSLIVMSLMLGGSYGQNPIIQTSFTADPAPMVYYDTVFLYTSHDEPDADGFKMFNWLLYTSTDMVNWTDKGIVASLDDFKWARKRGAWAPQVTQRNGKFYMYCPVHMGGIGVLVADNPYGPFKDPIGKPLINNSPDDIDPTVFTDDDGQAYLYWGNPDLYYVKLNSDMISFDGGIHKEPQKIKDYQEGPWFYKRKGHYYLAFASTCCPEGIGYAMSQYPTGPWSYKGIIMDHNKRSNGNHPGIIDYKGKSYLFGFNYDLLKQTTSVHHERRSVCVDELHYNPDGTIQMLPFWSASGPKPAGALNPYLWQEAETIAWSKNIKTLKDSLTGMYVANIKDGSYLKVRNVDFKSGAKLFEAKAAISTGDAAIELHVDSLSGRLIGKCKIRKVNSKNKWKLFSGKLLPVTGKHDLFFVFKSKENTVGFNFDKWQFKK